MNNEDRDNLLIRMDERIKALHDWSQEHKEEHKTSKANIQKWLGVIVTALVGIVSKIIFWK